MVEKTKGPIVSLGAARVYRALSTPLRHQIVMRTGERAWTPKELAHDLGQPLKRICEQVDYLVREELLELVDERPGPRGSTIHLYQAVDRFVIDSEEWANLSTLEQANQAVTVTRDLQREWIESLESGAFYDPDHVLIRTPLTVDRKGMKHLDAILCEAHAKFAAVARESAERCEQTGEQPIRVIMGLLSFPLPPTDS